MRDLFQKIGLFFLGVFFAILLVEIGLRAEGFLLSLQRQSRSHHVNVGNRIRILCIGDSFTWGFGSSSDESYPSRLEALINTSGRRKCEVINAGIPGMNSALIVEELVKKVNFYKPDIVIVNGGVNNYWNHAALRKYRSMYDDVYTKQFFYGTSSKRVFFDFVYRTRIYKLINNLLADSTKTTLYFLKPDVIAPSFTYDAEGRLFADAYVVKDGDFSEVVKYEGHPDRPIQWETSKGSYVDNFKRSIDVCYMEMLQFLGRKKIPLILETYLCNDEGGAYQMANDALREFAVKYDIPLVRNDTYIKNNGYDRKDLLMADGHPNAKGYEVMAENTYKVIKESL